MIAKFKAGFEGFYKGVDPQVVAEEIIEIGETATPKQILEKARDEETELHKCFEWDDSIAAEKFRIQQARQLVSFLVIREEKVPEDRPEIRFFYKTDNSRNEGYKQTRLIIQQEDEYKKLLEQAWRELKTFKAKYSCLKELQEIFELIN